MGSGPPKNMLESEAVGSTSGWPGADGAPEDMMMGMFTPKPQFFEKTVLENLREVESKA